MKSYDVSKSDARLREATSAGLIESWKLNAGFQLVAINNTSFSPTSEMSVNQPANKRPLQVVNSSPTATVSAGTAHIGVLKGYIAFRSKGKILRKACLCV